MTAAALRAEIGPRIAAACIAIMAWATLLALWASPYAGLLDHGSWTDPGLIRALCLGADGLFSGRAVLASLGAWVLMVLAMMWVPAVFQTPERRPDATALAGFLLIWTGYGIAAHLFGVGLGALISRSDAFAFSAWPVGAALFALAGLMELRGCTPPRSHPHWWGLGWASLRSCWALMGLMFAYFSDSLLWMMVLSVLMFVNCASPHRAIFKQTLGITLIGIAALITALNLL